MHEMIKAIVHNKARIAFILKLDKLQAAIRKIFTTFSTISTSAATVFVAWLSP